VCVRVRVCVRACVRTYVFELAAAVLLAVRREVSEISEPPSESLDYSSLIRSELVNTAH
jgi:hypothetical protein